MLKDFLLIFLHLFSMCFYLCLTLSFSVFSFQGAVGHFRDQWRLRDSNSRPPACKAGALPTELNPPYSFLKVGSSGLEPPTSRLSGARSNRLSYEPIIPAATYFPGRLQPSIISRLCLNRRVRYGYGCFPQTHRHRKFFDLFYDPSKPNS